MVPYAHVFTSFRRGRVHTVLLILITEVLENVRVRLQQLGDFDRERLRVHHGFVKRHLDVHVPEIPPVKAFGHAQLLAVRMTHVVQPGFCWAEGQS